MDRSTYIGSSDAKRIVDGDWLALYNEKKGITEPEDLSNKFNVQLGVFTESFHLDWLRSHCGIRVAERDVRVRHIEHEWLGATLDARDMDNVPIEVKHTNQFATLESMMKWYLPQLAHICLVERRNDVWFSFIRGNSDPVYHKINVPSDYIDGLFDLEKKFWQCMENDTPPAEMDGPDPFNPLINDGVLVDEMRTVDMSTHNEWAMLARNLIETAEAHGTHEHCKKEIKSLVDDDVRLAEGHGVKVSRNKRGHLAIKITEDIEDATAAE